MKLTQEGEITMGQDYKIKLGSVLSLDSVQEKDLVDQLEDLRSRHKLGEYITLCIRACYEKPNILRDMRDSLGYTGIHKDREEFFRDVSSQVKEMQDKINSIYDMAFTMYTMVQCGKRIGLEEKADNAILSSFLLKRQLDKIVADLGISVEKFNWSGADNRVTQDKADKVVELLIESYAGNILNEVIQETKRTVVVETTEQVQVPSSQAVQNTVEQVVEEPVEMQLPIVSEKDFESNANWGALNNFLNF